MNVPACSGYDDSLAFIRSYPRSLAKLAREYGEEPDDLRQDLHILYPSWMQSYDPELSKKSTFIISKLKWYLAGRRRSEFRHVTCGELDDDMCCSIAAFEVHQDDDLSSKPLPAGLPKFVLDTLYACRDCTCTADLAARLGITERGARKRLARAMELARTAFAAPQQGDLFGEAA